MLLDELYTFEPQLEESAKVIWARNKNRTGDKVVRKFRCTSGRKQGRMVATPSACGTPLDVTKSLNTGRKMKAMGSRYQRKAKMTKRRSPASQRVQKLNKGN